MNRSLWLLASGAALALSVSPAMAQQRTTPGFIDYLGAGVVISDVTDLDNGTALVVNAGKNIGSIPGLSAEGEVTTTISKPEASIGGVTADASYWTAGAYGVYTLPVSTQFDVRGRLGVLYENVDVKGDAASGDKNDLQVSGGVGGAFHVTDRFALTADYTRISEDINHFGAGVQFNF
jgi:hypothetical protein